MRFLLKIVWREATVVSEYSDNQHPTANSLRAWYNLSSNVDIREDNNNNFEGRVYDGIWKLTFPEHYPPKRCTRKPCDAASCHYFHTRAISGVGAVPSSGHRGGHLPSSGNRRRHFSSSESMGGDVNSSKNTDLLKPSEPDRRNMDGAVVLYGVATKATRFFVPSVENYFGGFRVEGVMFDSGCGSLLLPLKEGDLAQLLVLFPKGDYIWTIASGGGVAALQSPVLRINPIDAHSKIKLELGKDVEKGCMLHLRYLRFHISLQDANDLLTINAEKKLLQLAESSILEEHVQVCGILLEKKPNLQIGTRRLYALLGQSVLRSFTTIQYGEVCTLIVDPALWKPSLSKQYQEKAQTIKSTCFHQHPALSDLADTHDHDGDEGEFTAEVEFGEV